MRSYLTLPADLPVPVDDGACQHLPNTHLPDIVLTSTQDTEVDLHQLAGWSVIYVYPKTGTPGAPLPEGWDSIPGARGCTPQACNFRDHYAEFRQLGVHLFGLSTQTPDYQKEAATRLHLPFPLLSDDHHAFTDGLGLPTFDIEGQRLNKRLTLIAYNTVIRHFFYPVFPPDKHADQVLDWLKHNV